MRSFLMFGALAFGVLILQACGSSTKATSGGRPVPNVVQLDPNDAIVRLERLGFCPDIEFVEPQRIGGSLVTAVVQQEPEAGKPARAGTLVRLSVALNLSQLHAVAATATPAVRVPTKGGATGFTASGTSTWTRPPGVSAAQVKRCVRAWR